MLSVQQSAERRQFPRHRSRFLLLLVYIACLLPWIVPAAQRTLLESANMPVDWVNESFQPRRQYDQFCAAFGTADSIIVSWPECYVDEARIDNLVKVLRQAPAFQAGGNALFHHVTSGRELLTTMTAPPLSIDPAVAVDRLQGSLIGADGRTTCIVIGFTEQAIGQRTRLVRLIRQAIHECCEVPYQSQHLAGPIMDGYEIDRATTENTHRIVPLSSLAVLLICYLCLDSIVATLLIFGVSVFCQAVTFAVMDLTGGTMTALMPVLAPLIEVLAIAGGIHFFNYYFAALREGCRPSDAWLHALRIAWVPCVLSSVTTAVGLVSLSVSGLVAVREFGTYAAFGVLVTLVSLLAILPGFCLLRPWARPPQRAQMVSDRAWRRLSQWIAPRSAALSAMVLIVMIALGFGVARLEPSVRIETLFAPDSRLVGDYQWLESHVGVIVPIEIVTRFDQASRPASEQLNVLAGVQTRLQAIPQVTAVISPLTFLPTGTAVGNSGDPVGQMRIAQLAGERFNLWTLDQDRAPRWRTTAYVSALGDNDYVEIIDRVEESLSGESSARFEVSGLMPLVHHIQQQLLTDLFSSFLMAFGLIAVVMTIAQAGIIRGLLSMIPNVFPAITLFGILGWLGHPLDVGTMMTASVAMGIAVDDTLHFLTFYQRALDDGHPPSHAVGRAYEHCGRAMLQTSCICIGGLSLFIFSNFVPSAGFAWMSALLLATALLSDIVVLPAILLSPIGRVLFTSGRDRCIEQQAGKLDFSPPDHRNDSSVTVGRRHTQIHIPRLHQLDLPNCLTTQHSAPRDSVGQAGSGNDRT